jgi:hypothetical protein
MMETRFQSYKVSTMASHMVGTDLMSFEIGKAGVSIVNYNIPHNIRAEAVSA